MSLREISGSNGFCIATKTAGKFEVSASETKIKKFGNSMAEEALTRKNGRRRMPKMSTAGSSADGDICRHGDPIMAFFVLILSFAEFNVPKFKQISGSLKEHLESKSCACC